MQITDRTSDGLKRNYTVLISPEEIEEAFTKRLRERASKSRMDGFRPGKVPINVIKRLQGEQIKAEATKDLVRSISQQIIKGEHVLLSFDFKTGIKKQDENGLEYSLQFETVPTVDPTPVFSIELKKYVAEITEKEITEIFDGIRKEHKKWVECSEEALAEGGDKVHVELIAKVGIKHSKNSKSGKENISTDMDIVIGDPNIVENFWKPLVGKKVGDVADFSIAYPKTIGNKNLAGKVVSCEANIKKISRPMEYELDDEFAQSLGYENFSKLHEWAKERAAGHYEEISRGVLKRNLLEKISDLYDFEVPKNMFDIEFADVHRQLTNEAVRLGKPMSAEAEKECESIAASRVRLGFVVAEISKRNNITVSRPEIASEIKKLAAMYPGREKAIWNMYSHGAALSAVVGPILERKVVDFLFKSIKVVTETCTAAQLIAKDEETFDFFKDDSETLVEKLQEDENNKGVVA